jgi:hypothetical protein
LRACLLAPRAGVVLAGSERRARPDALRRPRTPSFETTPSQAVEPPLGEETEEAGREDLEGRGGIRWP